MTVIFNDSDLLSAYSQKRKLFWFYMLVLAVFAALCITCLVVFMNMPYKAPAQAIPKWIVYVASVLFVIFSFPYLGIKYLRIRKYYKLIAYLSVGLKQVNESKFLRYEDYETKDGVDLYILIFSEWNAKKSEYMDRKIMFDKEKPLPEFQGGDIVRYLSQGNLMVAYEVIGHDDSFVDEKGKEDKRNNLQEI